MEWKHRRLVSMVPYILRYLLLEFPAPKHLLPLLPSDPAYRGAERAGHGAVRLRQGPVPAALPVHAAAGEVAAAPPQPNAEPSGPGPGRQPVAVTQPAEPGANTGGRRRRR